MLNINHYVVVESLEEAYELNKKKGNVILGGTGWLKMTNKNIQTAIDLSLLGLDKIEETEEEFSIGCMVTLRELETNISLSTYSQGSIKEAVKGIVGVQFRNCATVGGSVFSRFGFSDILTNLLCFDGYVELFHGGIISLEEFGDMPRDNDVIVRIILKKSPIQIAYHSFKNQATDLPVLTCGGSLINNQLKIVIGAKPSKASVVAIVPYDSQEMDENKIKALAEEITNTISFQSNLRGSAEYRAHLSKILIKRVILQIITNQKGKE